jgi:hypothetical protein
LELRWFVPCWGTHPPNRHPPKNEKEEEEELGEVFAGRFGTVLHHPEVRVVECDEFRAFDVGLEPIDPLDVLLLVVDTPR